MKNSILLFFIVLASQFGNAQMQKKDKIESLISLQNTQDKLIQNLTDLISTEINNSSKEDSLFWEEYKSKFILSFKDSLYPIVVSIYDKYYTDEEIDAMYAYYNTNVGKSTLEKTEKVMKELIMVGGQYGRAIAEQIIKEKSRQEETAEYNKMNNEFHGCEKFRIGKFKYIINDSTILYYDRLADSQIESLGQGESIFKITWLNDCRYVLILEKTNNPYLNNQIGSKMTINIYEFDENSYKYAAQIENDSKVFYGELIKVE